MRNRCMLVALMLALIIGSTGRTRLEAQGRDGDEQRISELVKQLGSSKFNERSQAQKELEAIGAPALEALRKAAKDEDLETAKRATELVRKLEERMLTANVLSPKRVHLKVKDMPVLAAVAELSRLSGYPIQVQGDHSKVADKNVTLDTGDVTFWEALDKLCEKTGLSEAPPSNPNNPYLDGLNLEAMPALVKPLVKARNLVPAAPGGIGVPAKAAQPKAAQPKAAQPKDEKPAPDAKPAREPKPASDVKASEAKPLAKPAGDSKPDAHAKSTDDGKSKSADDGKPGSDVQPADQSKPGGNAGREALEKARAEALAKLQAEVLARQARLLQLQAQAAQVQIFPAQGGGPGGGFGPMERPASINSGIILVPEAKKENLVSYAGAVRVRTLPTPDMFKKQGEKAGQYIVMLDVAAEPKLQSFNVTNSVTIVKAIDDQGQILSVAANMPMGDDKAPPTPVNPANQAMQIALDMAGQGSPYGAHRQVVIRLKAGEKQAKLLSELSGSVAATVQTPPEALISVDNVLKAAGTTTKGKDGGALEIHTVEKQANGDYKVSFRMEMAPANNIVGGLAPFPGRGAVKFQGIQIKGNIQFVPQGGGGRVLGGIGHAAGTPELVDAKGTKYQVAQIPNRRFNFNNGVSTQEMTVVYHAPDGAGEPDRLVVSGSRTATITIPFAFRDVPLP